MAFPDAVHFLVTEATRFVSPTELAVEWMLVAVAGLVISFAPVASQARLGALRAKFRRLANRKRTAILICGALPIVLRLSMLGFAPPPEPSIHDEFSHLLLADTLAHGRLSNPTHPMWKYFESIHIIQRPTYNSMYPPGQGAILALGEVAFHRPWAGVVLSVGLMCATICWMMQGWLPPAWALFGTLVAILKIAIVGFWMNSYMGGSVAAIGGALLIGSLPRLRAANSRTLHAILLALGLVTLMITRPFEGGLLSASALLYLSPALWRRFRTNAGRLTKVFIVPVALLLGCGVIFTCYYDWKVTGNPLEMPYQVNRDTYGWPENLAVLPAKELVLEDKVLQRMYVKEIRHRDVYKEFTTWLDNIITRIFDNWAFFIGPILTLPLVFLPWILRSHRTRALVVFACIIAAANLFQMVLYPYHLAPIVPVIFAIVAQGIRYLYVSVSRLNRSRAAYLAVSIPLCLTITGAMKQETTQLYLPFSSYWEQGYEPHRDARASIEKWLNTRPGKQLVIVHYASSHPVNQEWVYNHADIDNSKVVWAREIDEGPATSLLKYFSDRHAWLLDADVYPPRVVPYNEPLPPACLVTP